MGIAHRCAAQRDATVKSRNVCVVTGTRADYGARPVMQAIQDSPGLHLQACITGMHLLKRFGQTGRIVEQDGWPETFRVAMQADCDSPTSRR